MKKLLLAALFIIGLSSVASAQQKHGYSQTTYITEKKAPKKLAPVEPGYQSTVSISCSFVHDGNALFVEYIGGYRFNNTLFLGAGIGLGSSLEDSWIDEKSHAVDSYYRSECKSIIMATGFAYRLYVNGRCYLSKTRLQPFLGAAIGFEGYKTQDGYIDYYCMDTDYYHKDGHKAGFYAMPEVGLNYRISNRTSTFLSIGYGATICTSGLQVKLGATF